MKIYSVKHFWRMCKLPSVACKNFEEAAGPYTHCEKASAYMRSYRYHSKRSRISSGVECPGVGTDPWILWALLARSCKQAKNDLGALFAQVRIINLNRTCRTETIWKIRRNGWQVGSIILFLNSRLKRRLIWLSTQGLQDLMRLI